MYDDLSDSPKNTQTREWRDWDGGDNISQNPWENLIDAVIHPVSGQLLWVRVPAHDQETVLIGSSDDGGATLTEDTLHNQGGALFWYPTLAVDPLGRVVVIWGDANDTTLMYWALSERYGRVFETAASDAWPSGTVAGDACKLRYHPLSGHGIMIHRDQTGPVYRASLWEAFSAVTGPDEFATADIFNAASPHYGSINFDPAGQIVHVINDRDEVAISTSDTWGRSWSTSAFAALGQFQIIVDTARRYGLSYWAYQEADGDVKANPADNSVGNPPDTTGYGSPWSVATAVATLPLQQYVGLAAGPNGVVYLLYQTESGGTYSVNCRVSKDNGASWGAP